MEEFAKPVPLFGQHASFIDALASDDPDEASLIALALSRTDCPLEAIESHKLGCVFLQMASQNRRLALRDCRSIIEKLLLWCILVRKKSLLDISNADLIEFLIFLESPPETWLGIPAPRFIHSRHRVVINSAWRPFRSANKSSGWCRRLLRYFLSSMKGSLQEGLIIPRKPCITGKQSQINDAVLEAGAERYLAFLASSTSPRGRHEKQLFIFACCYYMRLSLPEFAKVSMYIGQDSFVKNPNDQWVVTINSPDKCISRNLPREFDEYFTRYNLHLNHAFDSVGEFSSSLFCHKGWDDQPNESTIYDWGVRLPNVVELGISAPKLLKLLSGASVIPELEEGLAHHRQIKARKDARQLEMAYQSIIDRWGFRGRPQTKGFNASDVVPVPFFKQPLLAGNISWHVDFDNIYKIIGRHVNYERHACCVAVISAFISFSIANVRNSRYGPPSGYEKFILWSLIIKKASPSQMSESDADEFYDFCVSPPKSWASSTCHPKFIKTSFHNIKVHNPNWRPFTIVDLEASLVRAARIISWCSIVQDWLVSNGLSEKNIFKALAKELWLASN